MLLLDGATAGWTTSHLFCVYRSSLKDPLFYLRLFGHVLGHADLDHFLNNMLLFLVIGPPMEEKYGSIPLLKAIILTALVSGDRKSTRLNSSHSGQSRMPSSA